MGFQDDKRLLSRGFPGIKAVIERSSIKINGMVEKMSVAFSSYAFFKFPEKRALISGSRAGFYPSILIQPEL